MPNGKPSVAAVVVTFNNVRGLAALLADICGQSAPPREVIVIDNASTDGTRDMVRRDFPHVHYQYMEINGGSAGGFHEGLRIASGGSDLVWTLDDDVRLKPDTLEKLVSAFNELRGDETAAVVCSVHSAITPLEPRLRRTGGFRWRGTLIKSSLIREIGLPRKEYFLYADDMEFMLRARRRGYCSHLVTDSVFVDTRSNDASGAFMGRATSYYTDGFRLYYAFRNETNTCLRYLLAGKMCLIAAHGLKITAGLLTGQGMRAAARTGGTIAAGIIDGLLFRLGKNPKYLPGPAGTLPEPVPVLFFSNYASLTRGGQKSIWYILRDIDRMRYRPVLACQEEGQLTELARAAGIPVEIVPLPRLRLCALPAIFACLRQFRGMLDRHRIRVVHSEELVVIALMSVLKPFHRVRLIWHVRVNWDYPLQKRIGLLLADRIICVSRAVARRFPASRRVSVAQNGVDAAECVPGPSAIVSERFNGGDTVIGCFATVAAHKGQHVLIRAAARLAGTYPGLKFLLAGDGEPRYLEELRALAGELHVTQNIIFWGAEKDDVRGLLRRVDIFVLPSFVEGLSRSLLEAMAFARPVIASDIPENAEAVTTGENGLLFKAGDADDLAAKIAELMADRPRAQRLGENARARVLRDFSLESTMRNIYAVYESFGALCGRRNG